MIPAVESAARDKLARVAGRQALSRWTLWGSVAVVAGLYLGLAFATVKSGWVGVYGWSLFAMAVVPAWASLVVLISCATTFPAERDAGTLDGLLLTPLSAKTLVEALMRPRLRLGLIVLAAGAPFYLMPHKLGDLHSSVDPAAAHIGLLSTFWRPLLGDLGLMETFTPWFSSDVYVPWWPSFLSGPAAFFIDATRLYAFAALGMAASILARTTTRAVVAAIGLAAAFLFVTFLGEWAGAAFFLYATQWGAPIFLAISALFFEGWAGNVAAPRAFLNARLARADERLTDGP